MMGVYNIAIMRLRTRAWMALPAALRQPRRRDGGPEGPHYYYWCSCRPSGLPMPPNATLTAVPGIKVGHHTLTERPTGCTVVLIEAGATAGVDVRGAAPATRDTDLLQPTKMVQQIHGIALSGGSLFGLSSGDGVLRYLEEKNIGIVVRRAAHSDRAGRLRLRPRRRRREDPPDRRLRLSRGDAPQARRRSSKAASAPARARRSASCRASSAR